VSSFQLRRYDIKPGEMSTFLDAWNGVLPVRQQYGFTVVAAVVNSDDNEFTWIVRHDGDEAAFKESEKAYYDSPEREALPVSPVEYVAQAHVAIVSMVHQPGS
jgi:hypothetical protein